MAAGRIVRCYSLQTLSCLRVTLTQALARQQQHSHPYFRAYPVTLQEPTASSDSDTEDARPFSSDSVASAEHPRIAGNNNGLRIDVVKTTLVGTRIHDTILPLEKKPGVSKLSIPDFILRPFSSTS